jgi:protein gp37
MNRQITTLTWLSLAGITILSAGCEKKKEKKQ